MAVGRQCQGHHLRRDIVVDGVGHVADQHTAAGRGVHIDIIEADERADEQAGRLQRAEELVAVALLREAGHHDIGPDDRRMDLAHRGIGGGGDHLGIPFEDDLLRRVLMIHLGHPRERDPRGTVPPLGIGPTFRCHGYLLFSRQSSVASRQKSVVNPQPAVRGLVPRHSPPF
ncbi:MAG: hypothetical protein AVDCRST_MAG18-4312 [uncultured Thermomicrobiales bacterium]|uniref:Uncharacterized protein n=1 Tax=uncultured Thermomicrobiales bacterium TaxID=1645740 RepID=A0A6J4VSR7_9BACT|nr:MAG: hypothetical protein AVDCRST_MAG18-4312 [uncultured Thermomicrobiales bacterium]